MAGCHLAWLVVLLAVGIPLLEASPTGLNLPRLDVAAPHYGGSWASASSAIFTNLFKHSTPFECQSRGKGSTGAWGWGPGEALTWRPDGYPAEIRSLNSWSEYCAVARVGAGAAYYAAGKYVLLYSGDGKVTLEGDASVTAEGPGRLELSIKLAAGFAVRIVRTNATNPVRNISIVPAAAEFSFADTPYQASFLELVKGFDVLRFAWWQRIWGDARNPQMLRSLADRATPASATYLGKDGVSWQDMVTLANQVGADPWFNLPLAATDSDPYANAMATYVAQNLAPERRVYIEYGFAAPGWMTTEYPTNLVRVARIWRAAFAAAGLDSKRVVVVATYEVPAWIPYLSSTFGANISQVDAVAVVGSYGSYRSWNSNRPCFYEFSSNTFAQDPKNAGIDLDRVLQLARSSVIHADVLHNSWHQRLRAMGKRLIAVQAGPDRSQMAAAYYSMRQNYNNILGCKSYPCTRSGLFPPASSSSMTFATEAERNATLAQIWPQAQNEWRLDELLMQSL
uniref:Uncharacterized protein n=1 Tax=Tetradesmus obliquus TaxID=3088 RepID=A0A383V7X4_TETOB|eukprot:jgi/Sobl393_1/3077/SZX61271.1